MSNLINGVFNDWSDCGHFFGGYGQLLELLLLHLLHGSGFNDIFQFSHRHLLHLLRIFRHELLLHISDVINLLVSGSWPSPQSDLLFSLAGLPHLRRMLNVVVKGLCRSFTLVSCCLQMVGLPGFFGLYPYFLNGGLSVSGGW